MNVFFFIVLAWNASAGTSVKECYESAKQNIKECKEELDKTSEESTSRNGQLGLQSTNVKIEGSGSVLSGAHFAEAVAWRKLAESCEKKVKDCQNKCTVKTTEQRFADRYLEQCEDSIGKIVKAAKTSAKDNEDASIAAQNSGKKAGQQPDAQEPSEFRQVASNGERQDIPTCSSTSCQDRVVDQFGNPTRGDIADINGNARVQQAGVVSSIDYPLAGGGRGTTTYGYNGSYSTTLPNRAGTTTTTDYDKDGNVTGGQSGWKAPRPR